jgi:zinc transport system ATP-binding protein
VIENLSFAVNKGDFLCVTGVNGAGKTTLLKLILRTLKPDAGEILIDYKAHRISYVPQSVDSVNKHFPATAGEVVSLGLYPVKDKMAEKVDAALDMVKLPDCKKKLIGTLSGGQRQRVFIAKALASKPDIMLLDEPTVGIDSDSLGDICCLIGDINKSFGVTVLMVTHDVSSIINHANKVLNFGGGGFTFMDAGEYKKRIFH